MKTGFYIESYFPEQKVDLSRSMIILIAKNLMISHSFKISMVLNKDKILKPRAQIIKDHGKYVMDKFVKYPYDWSGRTIYAILTNIEYLGHLVCNQNTSKSFKDRTLVNVPKEDWIIVENTHEALVNEETFNIVQPMIEVKKSREGN